MNNSDLADHLSTRHGLTRTHARELIDTAFAAIGDAAARGEDIALNGFGRFKVKATPARDGRHPRTGERMTIKASRKLTFTPAKSVKDKING